MSRVIYWLLGLLIVGLLFAGAAFLYVNTNTAASTTTSIAVAQSLAQAIFEAATTGK